MKQIQYFKANKDTKKFKKNQVVWVLYDQGNYISIRSRWRGKGRYVKGYLQKWNANGSQYSSIIGPSGIKTMDVEDDFYNRINK